MPRSVSSIPSMSLHWCAWSSVQDTRGLPKYSPKIGQIWLIRLVSGTASPCLGGLAALEGAVHRRPGHDEVLGVGGA